MDSGIKEMFNRIEEKSRNSDYSDYKGKELEKETNYGFSIAKEWPLRPGDIVEAEEHRLGVGDAPKRTKQLRVVDTERLEDPPGALRMPTIMVYLKDVDTGEKFYSSAPLSDIS